MTKLTTTQTQKKGYELGQPKVHPSCDLLEHMQGQILPSQSRSISTTQGNNRISKRCPSEDTNIDSVAETEGLEPDQ